MNATVRSIDTPPIAAHKVAVAKEQSRFSRYAERTEQFWTAQFGHSPTTQVAQVVTVTVLAVGFLVAFLPMVVWAVGKAVRP